MHPASRSFGLTLALLVLALLGFVLAWLTAPAPPARPAKLVLERIEFAELTGWREDRVAEAVPAMLRSCGVFGKAKQDRDLGVAGTPADWRAACEAAKDLAPDDDAAARTFFEQWFDPFSATDEGEPDGLFTGYYEASLEGSRTRSERYRVPLYRRPPDLVTVNLGSFSDELKGKRIAGRVKDGALAPFPPRKEIEAGALAGQGLELVWVDDPVDAFFLHIQGSGRVALDGGGEMRVGYAAQNGRDYLAIGRTLIERGALTRENVSMQSIRRWLADHPDEADEVMNENPSFIFFRELEGDGPVGAQGVALIAGRSIAVDRRHVPYGVPLWLETRAPDPDPAKPARPFRRLMVAQDTGGAIRGPVRGDVFWGYGEEAASVAGRMKHRGRWFLLLPKPAAAHLAPSS